jgi:hypothetical protein
MILELLNNRYQTGRRSKQYWTSALKGWVTSAAWMTKNGRSSSHQWFQLSSFCSSAFPVLAILCHPCLPYFRDENLQVEICLTSNVMTGGTPSLELHHFGLFLSMQNPIFLTEKEVTQTSILTLSFWICAADLYNAEHPLSLCTDDSGLFSTSLSNEYYLVAYTFGTLISLTIRTWTSEFILHSNNIYLFTDSEHWIWCGMYQVLATLSCFG